MKTGIRDQGTGNRAAEETLRLIARLDAPDGLENRVQESLRVAAVPAARILRWSAWLNPSTGWMQSAAMRSAAAVVIVAVVVGGGWIVSLRLPTAQSGVAITASPRLSAPGGFSTAGAKRTPQTLDRPQVATPPEAPAEKAAPAAKKIVDQPATRTPLHHGKPASAKRLPAETAGSASSQDGKRVHHSFTVPQ